jgi:conjugal transfer pilus assembly protein TraE
MNNQQYQSEKKARRLDVSTERLALLGSVAANVLIGAFLVTQGVTVKTHLVPPEMNKAMWVENNDASDGYLEEMSTYVSQLILNAAPTGVEYQGKVLKRYVCSDNYGVMDSLIRQNADRLKKDNATTLFSTRIAKIDRKTRSVALTGTESVFVGDRKIGGDIPKTYLTVFEINAGKFCVKEFHETVQDPFAPTAPGQPDKSAGGGP